ncbi:MAG: PD-(D/E)XK nuclease family protein [Acidobacteria bacterium]|nr:PD-(D/E)XK nuclease family protein [Acidobacteriota bacterium]
MMLLTGPAGSGKTHAILARIRERLRANQCGFRLLVPTATMAEHVRNSLAREGFVFSPGLILTFTKFVAGQLDSPSTAPTGALELAVRSRLEAHTPAPFAAVAGFAGFERTVAGLILDCSSAGCDSARLRAAALDHPYAAAFTGLYESVEQSLAARGWRLRRATLREAALRIEANGLKGIDEVLLDGFFQFTEPEIEVLAAIARNASTTVTLPDWPGAGFARRSLLRHGFAETSLGVNRRSPLVTVVQAPTLSAETEAIAARILECHAPGRPFRDIAIVVRGDNAYIPALRTSLARFGIPAAFLFGEPLAGHPAVRYLSALLTAMLNGWDHAELLAALRLSPSGVGATRPGDQFDFELRELLPGRGLGSLPAGAPFVDRLKVLETVFAGDATPSEWADRCRDLRRFITLPDSLETASHSIALLWRSIPAALAAFENAARETALALTTAEPLAFADFWKQLQPVLQEEALRVPDRRRDVVHVMDVHEARQWALPVVFVCGLLEKEFPRYHQQNPLLPDSLRRQLQEKGIRLRTSADHQMEEDFLFDLATTRATRRLFLSYPAFNSKGGENLRSFLLDAYIATWNPPVEPARGARPEPRRQPEHPRLPAIDDPVLRLRLAQQHARLGPTSIETHLQCAWRFFAGDSLRLAGAPAAPEDRLDIPSQGNIVHNVLAEWARRPQDWRPLFEQFWSAACQELRVLPGYKAESIRLELLRNLEMLIPRLAELPTGRSRVEERFSVRLSEDLTIKGKIDRLIRIGDSALLIDYKYTGPENIRKFVSAHEAGLLVQGGLYLIAAEEYFHLRPAGFLYCGAKKTITWGGWHTLPAVALAEPCQLQLIRDIMEQSRARALDVHQRIAAGNIVPRPADPAKCGFCDFADICRQETIPATITVEGANP